MDSSNSSTYRYQATSTGSAGTRSRRLAAVFAVDRVTGDVHLHVLEDAGHWVHVDNPEGLMEMLAAGLALA